MRVGKDAKAAGIDGRPGAGEERTDTLSRYGVDVHVPPAPPVTEVVYHEYGEHFQPEDQTLEGLVGTDGSMIHPRPVCARRAGWSAVRCDREGSLLYAVYGACPDRCPTAHRAELWAFLQALRRAVWPLVVMTDCKALIDCLDRGRDYCCDRNRKAADRWRKIR